MTGWNYSTQILRAAPNLQVSVAMHSLDDQKIDLDQVQIRHVKTMLQFFANDAIVFDGIAFCCKQPQNNHGGCEP